MFLDSLNSNSKNSQEEKGEFCSNVRLSTLSLTRIDRFGRVMNMANNEMTS